MDWYFYVGIMAAILIAIFSMPQLIKMIKTKNSVGISTAMFVLLISGDFLFVIQGIGMLAKHEISGGLPVFLANLISLICSSIVLFFKLRNVANAKKLHITEREFCDHYDQYRQKILAMKREEHDRENQIGA